MNFDTIDKTFRKSLNRRLPEFMQLARLIDRYGKKMDVSSETSIPVGKGEIPIVKVVLGNQKKLVPTLLITAGIHGVERIGTQVVLAYLETLLARSNWDPVIGHLLDQIKIVFVPLINPGGMFLNQRANTNGVDLMRNAPITAELRPHPFLGGQSFSSRLPWYCGQPDVALEAESQTLINIVEEATQNSPFTLSIDCHSGFGMTDRIWFPYAYRKRPIAIIDKLLALKLLLDETFPNHHYIFEPQALSYTTHGDLWDYMYKQHKNAHQSLFIPLTLEMGSWAWLKKRPLQIFSTGGLFNPIVPHRHARVLRRHIMLFDFLCSTAIGHKNWLPRKKQRRALFVAAKSLWYKQR